MFALITYFDKSVQLEWYYNEAHHGKGPMDGVGQTIKRVVFGLVKSNKTTIKTVEESIYFSQDDEIIKPSFIKVASYIQGTLDTHYVKRSFNSNGVCIFRIL